MGPVPKRPFITIKAAITLDGRVADAFGKSQWITGPQARAAGHRLRGEHDAILVGSGTLLADNPQLTTRTPGGKNAIPVVLDTQLRCPPDARVLSAGAPALVFCADDVNLTDLSCTLIPVPRASVGLDLNAVMGELLARGIRSVLVEGGPRVQHSLMVAGMVDRIHLFVNPRVLSGGTPWIAGAPFSLDRAPGYRFVSADPVGDDLHVILDPTSPAAVERPEDRHAILGA